MKLKKIISFACIAVLTAITLSACGTNNPIISLNLKKGDVYKTELINNQKITETLMGQNIEIDTSTTSNYLFDIQDVDKDGVYTIKITYKDMKVKVGSMGVTKEYDSAKVDESDPSSKCIGAIAGQSFVMKIDKCGNVKSVDGIDAMIEKILSSCSLDEKTKSSAKQTFDQILNEDVLKQQFEESMKIYPNKQIKKGDTWSGNINITKGTPMNINTKMTLKDLKDGVAIISEQSNIKANDNEEGMTVNGIKVKYSLNGTQNGTINLKTDNGLIMESKIQQDIQGTMKAEGQTEGQTLEIPVKIEGSCSLKMTK